MSINNYIDLFRRLNVNRSRGYPSPHKPCMLLAVIDLIEAKRLTENKIRFDNVLIMRYAAYFNVVKKSNDHLQPWMPFFALKNEKKAFWHLSPLPGRQIVIEALNTARKQSHIEENIRYAVLNDELFSLLQSSANRKVLCETLLLHWFPDHMEAIFNLFAASKYEKRLRLGQADVAADTKEAKFGRNTAFRRLVQEAYDFRCAASGWRVILPDYSAFAEAAHIVPFSKSHDNRPQNGIVLTPNYHRAMDRNVIAPGPDLKWHISKKLDNRIQDTQFLYALKGRNLLLPKNKSFYPSAERLEWRLARLI